MINLLNTAESALDVEPTGFLASGQKLPKLAEGVVGSFPHVLSSLELSAALTAKVMASPIKINTITSETVDNKVDLTKEPDGSVSDSFVLNLDKELEHSLQEVLPQLAVKETGLIAIVPEKNIAEVNSQNLSTESHTLPINVIEDEPQEDVLLETIASPLIEETKLTNLENSPVIAKQPAVVLTDEDADNKLNNSYTNTVNKEIKFGAESLSMTSPSVTQSPTSVTGNVSTASVTAQSSGINSQPNQQSGQQFGQSSGQQPNQQPNQQPSQQSMGGNQQNAPIINQTTAKLAISQEQSSRLLAATANDTKRSDKLLANLGIGMDKRSLLPIGLQSISQPVQSPQWGKALGQRVIYMANQKIQEAKITLNPEKLGPVQIKISIDKDNQMNITMTAQHSVTREALENAIPRLKDVLNSSEMNLVNVNVGQDKKFEQQAEQEQRKSSLSASNGTEEGEELANLSKVVHQSDNLIDYYA